MQWSTSIESPFTDCNNALYLFNFGFTFNEIKNLLWINDTSAPECSDTWYFLLFILTKQELGLYATQCQI